MLFVLETLFWLAALLTLLPYVIYPVVLAFGTRFSSKPEAPKTLSDDKLPSVAIIISAHNEELVIEEKVRSSLRSDYPPDKLSVFVVSDASNDGTNNIVREIAGSDDRVRLVELIEHLGKTAGLNEAMKHVSSDVVVFTDANAIFDSQAVKIIATELNGNNVGYVVGSALYSTTDASNAGESEGLYWRYELALKELESAFESVVGGDGAIYGIWRSLYTPLAHEDINDFMNPLQIIGAGYRGLFSARAIAFEEPANDFTKEFRRKRRIVCRSFGALIRYGVKRIAQANLTFTIMLFAHKVIRWFTLAWILLAVICNTAILAFSGPGFYVFSGGIMVLSMILACIGWRKATERELPSYFAIPYYFYMSNLAALLGIIDYAMGNRYVTWKHVRA